MSNDINSKRILHLIFDKSCKLCKDKIKHLGELLSDDDNTNIIVSLNLDKNASTDIHNTQVYYAHIDDYHTKQGTGE